MKKNNRTTTEKIIIGLNVAGLIMSIKNGSIFGIAFYATTTGLAIIETDPELAAKFNANPKQFIKDLL